MCIIYINSYYRKYYLSSNAQKVVEIIYLHLRHNNKLVTGTRSFKQKFILRAYNTQDVACTL